MPAQHSCSSRRSSPGGCGLASLQRNVMYHRLHDRPWRLRSPSRPPPGLSRRPGACRSRPPATKSTPSLPRVHPFRGAPFSLGRRPRFYTRSRVKPSGCGNCLESRPLAKTAPRQVFPTARLEVISGRRLRETFKSQPASAGCRRSPCLWSVRAGT
ncbi:hypothetical protein GQ53DRAFT_268046 [Thozetella sp. PMI_491]|nr:hypothetical protein GQ53DRAFT_268046 [Thozetella sp. PMI_491]